MTRYQDVIIIQNDLVLNKYLLKIYVYINNVAYVYISTLYKRFSIFVNEFC